MVLAAVRLLEVDYQMTTRQQIDQKWFYFTLSDFSAVLFHNGK